MQNDEIGRRIIINFYKSQLEKFKKIGKGNRSDTGVIVTDRLIRATRRRLSSLSLTYDLNLDGTRYNRRENG